MVKTQQYLKQRIKKIKWTNEPSKLGFAQQLAVKKLIDHYGIPAKKIGSYMSTIGLETKKQFLLWRDKGYEYEFLGLVNKKEKLKKVI